MDYNKRKPNRIRGGSTISQQVAKNVFLWQGRSFIRKGLEAYFTFMIELIWGKKRILEVYLNVIEMGKGIYGIEAASQIYFKKPASTLTRIPARPSRCRPTAGRPGHPPAWARSHRRSPGGPGSSTGTSRHRTTTRSAAAPPTPPATPSRSKPPGTSAATRTTRSIA